MIDLAQLQQLADQRTQPAEPDLTAGEFHGVAQAQQHAQAETGQKIQLAAIDNDLAMPASLDFGLQALNERFSGIVVDGVVSVDDTDFPVGGVRLSVHECRL